MLWNSDLERLLHVMVEATSKLYLTVFNNVQVTMSVKQVYHITAKLENNEHRRRKWTWNVLCKLFGTKLKISFQINLAYRIAEKSTV